MTHPFFPKIWAFFLITDNVAMAIAHKLPDLTVLKLQVSNVKENWLDFTLRRTWNFNSLMLNINLNNNNIKLNI